LIGFPLVLWCVGFGAAWSIPALVPGMSGILIGGVVGGAIAGSGLYALLKPPLSRTRVTLSWSLATAAGQALLRGVGQATTGYGMGDCFWIAAAAASGALSGALGNLLMGRLPLPRRPTPSRLALARLPFGMLLGGFLAGLVTAFYPAVLGGLFGDVSGFMLRLGIAFSAAGALMALTGAFVATRRHP